MECIHRMHMLPPVHTSNLYIQTFAQVLSRLSYFPWFIHVAVFGAEEGLDADLPNRSKEVFENPGETGTCELNSRFRVNLKDRDL